MKLRACGVLLLVGLATRSLCASDVALTFAGIRQPVASMPPLAPDPSGAAGPNDFAEFVNGTFATFDKSSGTQTAAVTDTQFWTNAGLSNDDLAAGVSNPRILFDPVSSRWFAVQVTNDSVDNRILVAASNSSSASPAPGNWTARSIPGNASMQGGTSTYHFAGFPTLGIDAGRVYVGTLNQRSRGAGDDDSVSLFSITKSTLLGRAANLDVTTFYGTTSNADTRGWVLEPAVNFSSSSSPEPVLGVSTQAFGTIVRTDVVNSAISGSTLSDSQTVTVADTQFPTLARQPDNTGYPKRHGLANPDDRIAASVYRVGDLLYLAHDIGIPTSTVAPFPDHSAVRWTVLRVDGPSTTVVQEGTIEDPRYDYFQPSIAADARGDIVLAYNRSGPSAPDGDVNAFFSVGTTDSTGSITFGPSQQDSFQTVTAYHNSTGTDAWGEYSSVSPDLSSPSAFWLTQEVSLADDLWGTQITELVVPEPAGASAIVAMLALYRRRGPHARWRNCSAHNNRTELPPAVRVGTADTDSRC